MERSMYIEFIYNNEYGLIFGKPVMDRDDTSLDEWQSEFSIDKREQNEDVTVHFVRTSSITSLTGVLEVRQ